MPLEDFDYLRFREGAHHAVQGHSRSTRFGRRERQEWWECLGHRRYWGLHREGKAGQGKQEWLVWVLWVGSGLEGWSLVVWHLPSVDLGQGKYWLGV